MENDKQVRVGGTGIGGGTLTGLSTINNWAFGF